MLFDLPVGDATIRPYASAGYQACVAASRHAPTHWSANSLVWSAPCGAVCFDNILLNTKTVGAKATPDGIEVTFTAEQAGG